MHDHSKKKRFLNLPKFPGGSEAFKAFIDENLQYPQAAIDARVAGSVVIGYDIHDDGSVSDARVLKGIGHGCDEEALRVVMMLRFEKVKNRGMRVKLTTKTTIHFRLPGVTLNYSVTYSTPEKKEEPGSYNYTVQF